MIMIVLVMPDKDLPSFDFRVVVSLYNLVIRELRQLSCWREPVNLLLT